MADSLEYTLVETQVGDDAPVFDFTSIEDVLIEVISLDEDRPYQCFTWQRHEIEECVIIGATDGIIGVASYEDQFGAGLRYMIEGMVDCPGEGWFVVEGITGHYTKGDWGFTDDNMDFDYKLVRPATDEERKLV